MDSQENCSKVKVTGQGHRGQITIKKWFFYTVSSMTQKVIDWFSWALAEWCRMIKGRLSSIIRKIGQWSLRSQRSNNHYKRTVPKLLPLYLLKFLTNVDELWQDETKLYVFRICLPLWWRFALCECLLVSRCNDYSTCSI